MHAVWRQSTAGFSTRGDLQHASAYLGRWPSAGCWADVSTLDFPPAQNLGTDWDERVLPSIGNEVRPELCEEFCGARCLPGLAFAHMKQATAVNFAPAGS